MKKLMFLIVCSFVIATTTSAQAKTKATTKPHTTMQKILAGSGLPYRVVNDSLAIIPYEGENIPSYQVVVQKASDLFIVYTSLTEVLHGKIDETKYKFLLGRNHYFDLIKIGLDDDCNAYVRADVYTANATTALLTRIIKQVANVTNILGGDLTNN